MQYLVRMQLTNVLALGREVGEGEDARRPELKVADLAIRNQVQRKGFIDMDDGDFIKPPEGDRDVGGANSLRLVKGVNIAVGEFACGLVLTVDQVAKLEVRAGVATTTTTRTSNTTK